MFATHCTASKTKSKLANVFYDLRTTYIEGPYRIPGFRGNGPSEINLKITLRRKFSPTIRGGRFSHIGILDLDTVDEDDPMWENDGIREEGNTEERLDAFENAYEVEGFKTDVPPPLVGTNGIPRDSRAESSRTKRRGEKQMPVFYYVIDDDSEKSRISDGLENNLRHPTSFSATMESVVVAFVSDFSERTC